MRISRGLLFWGLFLLCLGAIPLLVRANVLDVAVLGDAWRLWPLILVGIGVTILLARTRVSLIGTSLMAVVLGTFGGAAIASGAGWIVAGADCGRSTSSAQVDRTGTFDAAATVKLNFHCGSLALATQPGAEWRVRATHEGPAPIVDASGDRLAITVPNRNDVRHQDWTVTVPTDRLDVVDLSANAAASTVDLAGTHLSRVRADVNAGDLRVDASGAVVGRFDLTMNAGRIRMLLGSGGGTSGQITVNAGALDVCAPAGATLRFVVNDQLAFGHNLAARGLSRDGTVWRRIGAAGAVTIDLTIEGNAASLTLDPDGGCK